MIEQTLKEGANSVVPTHPIGAFTKAQDVFNCI
jgi:hypothetical protein